MNMSSFLTALKIALGIQISACLAAPLIVWIPIGGLPSMIAITASLVAQIALLISAFAFLGGLAT